MTQPNQRLPDGTWVAATEAIRDAIGSNEGLIAGQRCLTLVGDTGHQDNEIDVCESVDGDDASTWSRKRLTWLQGSYNAAGSAALRYIPFDGTGENATITTTGVHFLASYDGVMTRAVLLSRVATMAITIFGLHLDDNTTPTGTDTQSIGSANVAVEFTLGLSFSRDQRVACSVDPAGAANEVSFMIELEMDLLT